jgi:hypothetical protein
MNGVPLSQYKRSTKDMPCGRQDLGCKAMVRGKSGLCSAHYRLEWTRKREVQKFLEGRL